jgi:AraC-like DNA-binding protein
MKKIGLYTFIIRPSYQPVLRRRQDGSTRNQHKTMTAIADASPPAPWERRLPTLIFSGRFAAHDDCARHTHATPEIVLVTEGACRIEVGGRWLDGSEGTLFILPAYIPQYQRTLRFTRTSYFGFRADPNLFDTTARTLQVGADDLATRLTEEICGVQRVDAIVAGGLLLALLGHLGIAEARYAREKRLHPGLAAAIAYVESHLEQPLRIAALADHACVSPSHLTALFRRQFGCGPHQYQQRLRMEHASRLLTDPHRTIGDIAFACGYDDPNYFARLFRRHHGLSPQEWRRSGTYSVAGYSPHA